MVVWYGRVWAHQLAMKGAFSAPGDYTYFKSQVPLHKIPVRLVPNSGFCFDFWFYHFHLISDHGFVSVASFFFFFFCGCGFVFACVSFFLVNHGVVDKLRFIILWSLCEFCVNFDVGMEEILFDNEFRLLVYTL
jgi:hypothetical protein